MHTASASTSSCMCTASFAFSVSRMARTCAFSKFKWYASDRSSTGRGDRATLVEQCPAETASARTRPEPALQRGGDACLIVPPGPRYARFGLGGSSQESASASKELDAQAGAMRHVANQLRELVQGA